MTIRSQWFAARAKHSAVYWRLPLLRTTTIPAVYTSSCRYSPAYFNGDKIYNLDKDLDECTNVAAAQPEVLAEMKKRLAEVLTPRPHTFGEFKKGNSPPIRWAAYSRTASRSPRGASETCGGICHPRRGGGPHWRVARLAPHSAFSFCSWCCSALRTAARNVKMSVWRRSGECADRPRH